MILNRKKIIYSLLKEIENNEVEPKAKDYGISITEFGDIIDMIEEEGLIKGSEVTRGGQGNKELIIYLDQAKISMKGLNYLEENSSFAKTYRGLKEIREWLPL